MRSRYCAYVLDDVNYLAETWHRDFRPAELTIDQQFRWIGLRIITSDQQDQRARVEFEACLLANGKVEAMHEKSAFILEQGRWLYTSGEMLTPSFEPWKPDRNESCPCGSDKKFKRCCA